jgi:hypothetical protein
MPSEATPDLAREASGSYEDLFLPAPDAEASGQRRAVPDESEAAMVRLRAPFDVGPVESGR